MRKPPRKEILVELFGEQLPLDLSLGFLAQASFETGHKILEDPTFFGELDEDGKPKAEVRPGELFRKILLVYAGLLHLGRGWTLQDVMRQVNEENIEAVTLAVMAAIARDMMAVQGPESDTEAPAGEDPTVATSGSASGQSEGNTSG